jgi:hypothetical protein
MARFLVPSITINKHTLLLLKIMLQSMLKKQTHYIWYTVSIIGWFDLIFGV